MTKSTALFSVVIPNWNGAQYLPTCLNALRAQTYPGVEVIVVPYDCFGFQMLYGFRSRLQE